MYKIAMVILLLNFMQGEIKAQTEIEFYPKLLDREIKRINGDQNELKELVIPEKGTNGSMSGSFFTVSSKAPTSAAKYIYIGRVKTCRAGGCTIDSNQSNSAESEYFDYFILYNSNCNIQLVRIYNYQATHGQEVSAKSWLKQFIGFSGESELRAGKNIDAISGATISVDAITLDIEYRTELLKQTLKY